MRLQDLLLAALAAAPICSQSLTTTEASSSFRSSAICYDQARQRLTVFSGGGIWDWDGTRWARLSASAPFLSNPTWSTTHQRILALSGANIVAFDGHSFETLATVPGPVAHGRLIADTQTGEIVVLVPSALNGAAHYRWNGSTWNQSAPTPAQGIVLTHGYDEGRGVAVVEHLALIGGIAYETYEWDGSSWALRATASRPHGLMAYDYGLQRLVATRSGPSYSWDGSSWTQLTPGSSNEPTLTGITSGPLTGGTFGHQNQPAAGGPEILLRTQQSWTPLPTAHPLASGPEFAFDSIRGRAILMDADSMHEFDGNNWIGVHANAPPQRRAFALVHDEARQQTVLFGGASTQVYGDTWVWDGTTWSQAAFGGPPARSGATLTYDSGRQRVVLLGGTIGGPTSQFSDHWEWDGVTWTLVNSTVPWGPIGGATGYDRVQNRVVHIDAQGTTWQYDGQTWSAIAQNPNLTPQRRSLVWNGLRQELQGTLRNSQFVREEYTWDGSQWQVIGPEAGALVYDPGRNAILEYSAVALTVTTATPATVEHYGTACGGQTTATSLTAFGRARPGTTDLHLDLRAEATIRPAVFVLGTGRGQLALGNGCFLRIQNPIASVLSFTDAFGVRSLPLPILDDAGLLGTRITTQAVVLDPNSAGGLAVTQGLELAIGS